MGVGLEGWVKKEKGLRSAIWLLQNSYGNVKYNIENIVTNTLITKPGVGWVWDLLE